MIYPLLSLDDHTEIVCSDVQNDGRVKIYIEKPVEGGFCSATCWLPDYLWENIKGFTSAEIEAYQRILETMVH